MMIEIMNYDGDIDDVDQSDICLCGHDKKKSARS